MTRYTVEHTEAGWAVFEYRSGWLHRIHQRHEHKLDAEAHRERLLAKAAREGQWEQVSCR